MKSIGTFSAIIAAGLFLAPAIAHGDYAVGTIGLNRTAGYYKGSGGEFTMTKRNAWLLNTSAYADSTKNVNGLESFQTFCMERKEYTAGTVGTKVSTTSIDEGTGVVGAEGSGSHADKGGKTWGDNLDPRTAYLYTMFATGILSNYDYVGVGAGRKVSAGDLQNALWWIEEENPPTLNAQSVLWIDEAQAKIDAELWSGIGNVRILNNYSNGRRQDQIWLSPVSVPVPAAFLLGLPLLGLVSLLRLARRPRS